MYAEFDVHRTMIRDRVRTEAFQRAIDSVVRPGDIVVADADGIVVVPLELLGDVADAVATKHRLEGDARADLLAGMGIREVWTKYGVL
jgi:regulator of RNase E activity RraA